MAVSKVLTMFVIALSFVAIASSLSAEEFLNQISTGENNPKIDIQKIASTAKVPEQHISPETKQIAYAEILQKLNEKLEIPIIVWVNKEYNTKEVLKDFKNIKIKYIYKSLNGFAGTANEKEISALHNDQRINYIAFDRQDVGGHLLQSRAVIQANTVESNYSLRGTGVGVCHLDTGINYNHASLVQAYAGGYDFVNNDPDPFDDNGHGTATAGVIASNATLFRGIAPKVNLLAVKVLNASATGSSSNIAAGIDWCITNKNTYNISVISMSSASISTYPLSLFM